MPNCIRSGAPHFSIATLLYVVALVAQIAHAAPLVISTWPFVEAVKVARQAVERGTSAIDAVVEGCATCERLRCDGSVGYGGSPDENGETTLDAMVMDGTTMNVGAVGALRFVKEAVKAARLVLMHTEHTLLVGDQASAFALSLGLPGPVNLSTSESLEIWAAWQRDTCQPNFWKDVIPNSQSSCGPYRLSENNSGPVRRGSCKEEIEEVYGSWGKVGHGNHDTVSMAVIDIKGDIAVATSTNGATFKIPGRVGDGPIVGAAAYADTEVGACGATGDGDIMMRFLPCYQVVESMRRGMDPKDAAVDAIVRIREKFPSFIGALFAVDKNGMHAGACHGWTFQYSMWKKDSSGCRFYHRFSERKELLVAEAVFGQWNEV